MLDDKTVVLYHRKYLIYYMSSLVHKIFYITTIIHAPELA